MGALESVLGGLGTDRGMGDMGWGCVPLEILDAVKDALEMDGVNNVLKTARLVNRHWRIWALDSVSCLQPHGDMPLRQIVNSINQKFSRVRSLNLKKYEGCLKGEMAALASLSQLACLVLDGQRIADADLQHAGHLTALTHLDISSKRGLWETEITDAGIAHLQELTSLEYLDIGNSCWKVTDAGLESVGHLTCLTHLDMSMDACEWGVSFTEGGMVHVAKLPALRKLFLRGCCNTSTSFVLGLVYLCIWCKQLEHLDITSWMSLEYVYHVGGLTTLTSLTMDNCSRITGSGGFECIGILGNLQCLSLRSCTGLENKGLAYVVELTHLRVLALERCCTISDEGLRNVGRCVCLEHLDISCMEGITDTSLRHIKNLKMLTCLELSWCIHISDSGLEHLGAMTRLEQLHVSGCQDITDVGLGHLGKFSSLVKLKMCSLPLITDKGLGQLKGLKGLTFLKLENCCLTSPKGVRRLRNSLPLL